MAIFVNKYYYQNKYYKWDNGVQHNFKYYIIYYSNYLNFQIATGANVAVKKDRNSKDCNMNVGKKSAGKIIPTNRLFEKSGDGNIKKPPINPIIIETYAVFSLIFLL